MKRRQIFNRITALFLCLFLLFCASCGRGADHGSPEPEEREETDVPQEEEREGNASGEERNNETSVLMDEDLSAEEKRNAELFEPISEPGRGYSNVSDLVPESSVIVTGTVQQEIRYTYESLTAVATTWYEFRVEECWKGGLQPGDVITIAQNGGYYTEGGTGAAREKHLVRQSPLRVPLPEMGDRNLLFLTDWTDGSYCALSTFMARYYITEEGKAVRFIPHDDFAYEIISSSTDPVSLEGLKRRVQAYLDPDAAEAAEPVPEEPVLREDPKDLTVSVPDTYTLEGLTETEGEFACSKDDMEWTYGGNTFRSPPEVRRMFRLCDAVLVGTVENLRYGIENDTALTYYDLSVEECWKGSLIPGDRVTVSHCGGYMMAEEYNQRGGMPKIREDQAVQQNPYHVPLPLPGDRMLLFLDRSESSGVYSERHPVIARYYIAADGSLSLPSTDNPYANAMANGTLDPMELDEMRTYVGQIRQGTDGERPGQPQTLEENRRQLQRFYEGLYRDDEEQLNRFLDAYDAVLNEVDASVSRMSSRPTVLWIMEGPALRAAGGDTFQNDLIRGAGGINAAAAYSNGGQPTEVTIEEILDMDPDWLILTGSYEYDAEAVLQRPEWQGLTAVKEHRTAVVDRTAAANFLFPERLGSPTVCVGVAWLHYAIGRPEYSYWDYTEDIRIMTEVYPPAEEMGNAGKLLDQTGG